jgi:predicted DNA-binding protein
MTKSNKVHPKKRGRPATGKDPLVSARLPQAMVERLEGWAAHNGVTRSEAVRALVDLGLAAKGEAKPPSTAVRHARRGKADHASSMAGSAIDRLSDQSATTQEQANRKRRLVRGPSEFRDIRDRTIRNRDK